MKKEMTDHRLHSDYVRVLYDEAIHLNIGNANSKHKSYTTKPISSEQQSQINENKEVLAYNAEEGQKYFEKLTDILEDVDLIHRYIRMCAHASELESMTTQED